MAKVCKNCAKFTFNPNQEGVNEGIPIISFQVIGQGDSRRVSSEVRARPIDLAMGTRSCYCANQVRANADCAASSEFVAR